MSNGPLSNQPPLTTKQLISRGLSSVVYLLSVDDPSSPSSIATATGFFITPSIIATNSHCITDDQPVVIGRQVGTSKPIRLIGVLSRDAEHDLALILADTTEGKPLPLGDSRSVEMGDHVVVIGNPKNYQGTFSEGSISAIRRSSERSLASIRGDLIQISAPVSHGSSGSPVLNTHGQVIGVVAMLEPTGENLNFACPVNYLRMLLDRNCTTDVPRNPVQQFTPSADYPDRRRAANIQRMGDERLSRMEGLVFGFANPALSDEYRLDRLEQAVFQSSSRTLPIAERIQRLANTLGEP